MVRHGRQGHVGFQRNNRFSWQVEYGRHLRGAQNPIFLVFFTIFSPIFAIFPQFTHIYSYRRKSHKLRKLIPNLLERIHLTN